MVCLLNFKILNNKNKMDKIVWGKHFWYTIHYVSLGFPKNASEQDKKNYKLFYEIIGDVLPCEECSEHYKKLIKEIPIDNFLNNKNDLFEWTVVIHNEVNKKLNKPTWTLYDAKNYYTMINGPKEINNKNIYFYVFFIILILTILFLSYNVLKKN